ncbi:MAG: sensor domain-containing protein [Pseudomonadota bacterium]
MEIGQSGKSDFGFFDVIIQKQTYLNMLYLMLYFPLGIFYFTYLAAGFALGVGLIPVFVGIPVLYVFAVSLKYIMRFERKTAALLLGLKLEEKPESTIKGIGILRGFREEFFSKELWKTVFYLFSKFFIGMMVLTLCVSLASLSLALTAAPVILKAAEFNLSMNGVMANSPLGFIGISATPEQEMIILMIAGMFVGLGSIHLMNGITYLLGGFLKLMSPGRS